MERRVLEARLRQLRSLERNARDIYLRLSSAVDDSETAQTLRELARDEERHMALEEELLGLLSERGQ